MYLPKEKVVANHTFHKIHCNILSCRETMRSYELICLNTPHMWYVCYESAGRHTVDRKPSRPQKFHNQATLTTYVHCKLYEEVTVWCEGGKGPFMGEVPNVCVETEISSAMQISLCVVKKTTKINVGCAQMAHDLVSPSSCKENITKDKTEELKNRCRSPHEETEISSAMSIKTLADVIVGCKNNKCGLSTCGARPCET